MVMYYYDPSAVGGICRSKCDSQLNPSECCRVKAMLPNCKDADCEGALYIGGNDTAWDPYRKILTYQFPTPGNQYSPPSTLGACGLYPPCTTTTDPFMCCRTKPGMCYDPDCIGNVYRPGPGSATGFTRPPGAECLNWPPCSSSMNPQQCCVSKPAGCDPWCNMFNRAPLYVTPYTPTTNMGDCRTWPSCASHPNPGLCCQMKPPGCDPVCARRPRPRSYGSTFGNAAGASDRLYGVDVGYISD